VQTFADWTQQRSLLVNLEGHGREEIIKDVDLSRTVGWFTTLFPVLLELEAASEPGEALKAIKEQLRQIPNRGIGYGVLRYLQPDPSVKERSRQLPQPEVCFNYLGQFDPALQQSSLFSLAPESSGAARSPQGNRPHLLDITGFVVNGKLQLDWTYSAAIHKDSTVSSLAQKFLTACASLIAHCQSAEAGGYTPTDFPKAQLNQKDLDKLLAKINRTSEKKAK
jgi:non-ribosomal peptide synthase protein (TIGR01720 family)